MGEALIEKTKAEEFLRNKKFPWIIVRTGVLTHNDASGQYKFPLMEDLTIAGCIGRKDVENIIVKQIDSDEFVGRIVSLLGTNM